MCRGRAASQTGLVAYRQDQKGLAFHFFLEDLEAVPPLGLRAIVVATRWHYTGPAPVAGPALPPVPGLPVPAIVLPASCALRSSGLALPTAP